LFFTGFLYALLLLILYYSNHDVQLETEQHDKDNVKHERDNTHGCERNGGGMNTGRMAVKVGDSDYDYDEQRGMAVGIIFGTSDLRCHDVLFSYSVSYA
jgi:hypothetical protein